MKPGPSKRKYRSMSVDVSAKIAKKNENDDYISFPRCEYKYRFKRTSSFKMDDPVFWGTYYRSTKNGGNYDRLNTIKPEIPRKRTHRRVSSGIFQGPYLRHQYYLRPTASRAFAAQWSVASKERKNDAINANSELLYDQLLKYKCKLCEIVVDKCKTFGKKRMNVYIQNDFPCIIVQVEMFKNKLGEKNLYEICVAYFSAISNYIAKKNRIPIEMVIRASIGHNIPCVSPTKTSFRINIGVVPTIYATNVLVESLKLFNRKCQEIFGEKLELEKEEIEKINDDIKKYNEKKQEKSKNPKIVEEWDSGNTIFNLLCKRGDSSGKSVSFQITRLNQYIELLCDYVHLEIMGNSEELHLSAGPIRKMLKKFCFKNGRITMNIQKTDYLTDYFDFCDEENPEIKNDTNFWKILEKIASAIRMWNVVRIKKIHGLHSKLEEANSKFIKNCTQQSEDGYGSDSDGEADINLNTKSTIVSYFSKQNVQLKCFSKKVIVSTGMRAINLVFALAKCLTHTKEAMTAQMYYETRDAIKNAADEISVEILGFVKSQQKVIRFIDLNFCAKSSKDHSKVNLDNIQKISKEAREQVIVFDYTSATTDKINKTIRLFMPHVKVLLLVNSGSKNEQIGADNNPYGTIRIVSTEKNILNSLYSGLTEALDSKNEQLPKHLHNIRKAYKDIGAVVTNKSIFKNKWDPNNNE